MCRFAPSEAHVAGRDQPCLAGAHERRHRGAEALRSKSFRARRSLKASHLRHPPGTWPTSHAHGRELFLLGRSNVTGAAAATPHWLLGSAHPQRARVASALFPQADPCFTPTRRCLALKAYLLPHQNETSQAFHTTSPLLPSYKKPPFASRMRQSRNMMMLPHPPQR